MGVDGIAGLSLNATFGEKIPFVLIQLLQAIINTSFLGSLQSGTASFSYVTNSTGIYMEQLPI